MLVWLAQAGHICPPWGGASQRQNLFLLATPAKTTIHIAQYSNTVLCRDGKGQFPQQVGRWQAMAAATGCCSTCPLAGPEPDGRALHARLTSVRCARDLPQEVGHWLCSQNLWLHSGTAFRSSNPIARPMPVDQQGLELGPRLELSPLTNELWRFYLIQKDLMNGVGFKFTWGQLKLQKLIQRLFDNTVLIQTFSCKLFEQMKALTLDALGACLRRCSMPLIGILWAPGRGGNRWSWRCARVANVIVLTHTFHHHSLETFLRFMHQVGYL